MFLLKFKKFREEFQFEEIGVSLYASSAVTVPNVVFYIESKNKSAVELLQAIRDLKEKLPTQAQSQVTLEEEKDTSGVVTKLKFAGTGGFAVVAAPVSDNAIVLSQNEFLIAAAKTALSEDSAFFSATKRGSEVIKRIGRSDVTIYLSSEVVLKVAKPLIPLILSQKPELQDHAAEINEILDKLAKNILSTQWLTNPEENLICVEGVTELL